jgi:hypothetical protein
MDAPMAGTANDDSTDPWRQFRLLSVAHRFFLELTDGSKLLADRLTQRFLEGGEVDRDGRTRYKLYEIEAIPGGVAPSPYDGEFWRSHPECGIHCKIDAKNSSARWTGPTSKEWQARGRQCSEYDVYMIRVCWGAVLEFLQSAGLPAQDGPPTSSSEQPEPERSPDQESEPLSSTPQPEPPQSEPPQPSSLQPESPKMKRGEWLEQYLTEEKRVELKRYTLKGACQIINQTMIDDPKVDPFKNLRSIEPYLDSIFPSRRR